MSFISSGDCVGTGKGQEVWMDCVTRIDLVVMMGDWLAAICRGIGSILSVEAAIPQCVFCEGVL